MRRTDEIVREHRLTTVNDHAQHALRGSYGDRLLTMSRGRIVDDVPRAAQKDHLDEEQLIARSRKRLVGEVIDHLLG